ncbi:polysaccharide deacetylase family protein [Flavobacterium ranwuense]|uniref:Polysaccharide deacetylase family protein n=1 Tax=Flavobacterium ranwuense TaxID=2541725 RepID=A0ABY2DWH6_9FLAO|nr:polysaccharide deacetylase family protein [Flavobacterium ranwuense]
MLKHKITTIFFITILILLALLSFFVTIETTYFVGIGFIWFLIVMIGSSFISSNYHVKAYCNNPSEKEKKIALTFDDGPDEMTLLVLDLLKRYDAKATFFCIGKNIEKHPEILQRIVAEGHLVGNHSFSHSHFFDFYRKNKVTAELQKTNALIEKISGKKTQLFRPPYGVTNPSIRRALEITKHKAIGWNIRSLDGVIKNEKKIFDRIIKRVKPGGIVLLHDTSMHSVNVLEQFLQFLQKNNYTVVSLEQLLNIEAYEN